MSAENKKCFKCGAKKPLYDFYTHSQMTDGHLNKCKECTKKDVKSHYDKNRVNYYEYERKRAKHPQRKIQQLEYQKKRRQNDPERFSASYLTSNAIRDGRLKRKPCVICGLVEVEAHHEDYSNPLNVVWLCRKHHLAIHYKKVNRAA